MALAEIGARLRLRNQTEFTRGLNKSADEAGRLGDKLTDVERAARKAGDEFGGRFGRALGGAMGGLDRFDGMLRNLGRNAIIGTAAVTAAAAGLSIKFIQLATDAGETESKFKTVFGDAAPAAQKVLSDLTKRFGNTTKSVQDAAATFGVYGQAAGLAGDDLAKFSTGLVQAGLDLGSFYNADAEEAFAALGSGLSGEAEPLKRFAVFLNDTSLNAYAMARGIASGTKEMTDQQKIALRGQFILENLGKAQGDLERTSGGLANQQRALLGRLEEIGTTIGKALLPGATRAVAILNGKMAPAMEAVTDAAPRLERAFSGGVEKVAGWVERLVRAGSSGGLDGVVREMDNMTGAGGELVVKFDELRTIAKDVIGPTAERIARTFGKAISFIADNTTLAYVALGLYLARKTLLLAFTGVMKLHAAAVWLIGIAHGKNAVAATASATVQVGAAAAVGTAGAAAAVKIGTLRYAWAGAMVGLAAFKAATIAAFAASGPLMLGLAAFAAVLYGIKYTLDRVDSPQNIANIQNGTRTVTTTPTRSGPQRPITLNGRTSSGRGTVDVVPTYGSRQVTSPIPAPRTSGSGTASTTPTVNMTSTPVNVVIDKRVVGTATIEHVQERQARR